MSATAARRRRDAVDAPHPSRADRRLCIWLGVALFAGTLALYAPARNLPFIAYDDPEYVTENPPVRAGLTRAGVVWAFTRTHAANWHPLTWLSHMVDCELWGLAPAGHHATSVVLHAGSAALLFEALAAATGTPWPSAFVAAIFAAHPVRVESVAWISERKDVLAGLCWMIALLAWVRHAARPRALSYAVVVAAFVLGLLAKPMVVTLPVVLVLLDVWPLRRPWTRRVAAEIVPLVGLAAAAGAVTYLAQRRWGAVASLEALPVAARVGNALVALVAYVGKTVVPARLAIFYPRAPLVGWQVAGAAVLLGLVSAVVVHERRRRPYLLVGWCWYLVTLLPVIGLVQVGAQAMADRFLYLPQIGLLVMLAWGARELPVPSAATGVAAAAALAGCVAVTRHQLGYWRDSETLFRHAIAVTSGNWVAEGNLGAALVDAGRYADAIPHLREAIRLEPAYAKPHVSLGKALAAANDRAGAAREYAEAERVDPGNPTARLNAGLLLAAGGRNAEAIAEYRAALGVDPDYAKAWHALGVALAAEGRDADAIDAYRHALALLPDLGPAHGNLAIVLEHAGRRDEAIAEYRAAVRLMPDDAVARYDLAACLAGGGRLDEAAETLRAALRLRPGWPDAESALAEIEARRRGTAR